MCQWSCPDYHTSLLQTFRNRLVEVIDQAQHFAALGPAGGGGQSGDTALTFREGLEVTERERESRFCLFPFPPPRQRQC
jgi:hypothetical protein